MSRDTDIRYIASQLGCTSAEAEQAVGDAMDRLVEKYGVDQVIEALRSVGLFGD